MLLRRSDAHKRFRDGLPSRPGGRCLSEMIACKGIAGKDQDQDEHRRGSDEGREADRKYVTRVLRSRSHAKVPSSGIFQKDLQEGLRALRTGAAVYETENADRITVDAVFPEKRGVRDHDPRRDRLRHGGRIG